MKKMMKILSIGAMTSITALQVIACTDDSKYKIFLNDINYSKTNHTAIFGFLGSSDDKNSQGLFDIFDYWKNPTTKNNFEKYKNDNQPGMKKLGITDIELKSYQGPSKGNQSVSEFWNDKSISWQKNIFKWILDNKGSDNSKFHSPQGVSAVSNIDTSHLDGDKSIMFATLPIVFCIINGELYTAGQGWFDSSVNHDTQVSNLSNFITINVLQRASTK